MDSVPKAEFMAIDPTPWDFDLSDSKPALL
jgi:hypothetical protein